MRNGKLKFFHIKVLQNKKQFLSCSPKPNPGMTSTKNKCTKPLLFGVSWKQGLCLLYDLNPVYA